MDNLFLTNPAASNNNIEPLTLITFSWKILLDTRIFRYLSSSGLLMIFRRYFERVATQSLIYKRKEIIEFSLKKKHARNSQYFYGDDQNIIKTKSYELYRCYYYSSGLLDKKLILFQFSAVLLNIHLFFHAIHFSEESQDLSVRNYKRHFDCFESTILQDKKKKT